MESDCLRGCRIREIVYDEIWMLFFEACSLLLYAWSWIGDLRKSCPLMIKTE